MANDYSLIFPRPQMMKPELLNPGRKPRGNNIAVNKENPLAVGLHRFYLLSPQGYLKDLVSAENTLQWWPASGGENFIQGNLKFDGTLSLREIDFDTDFANAPEFSIIGKSKDGTPTSAWWTLGAFDDAQHGWWLGNNLTNNMQAAVWSTEPTEYKVTSNFTLTANEFVTAGITFKTTSNDLRLYINGEFDNNVSFGGTSYRPPTSGQVTVGSVSGAARVASGEIEFLATFKRVLTDAEMKSFMGNPYQVLKPEIP